MISGSDYNSFVTISIRTALFLVFLQSLQTAEAAERAADAAMQQAASALKDESDIATEVERIEKKLEQIGVNPASIIIQPQPVVKGKREEEKRRRRHRGC